MPKLPLTASGESARPLLVSSEMLLGSREAAQELGIDVTDTLREYGIDPRLLTSPEGYLARYQVIDFLDAVAERFDCHHFGLLVGMHQPPLRLGLLAPIFKLSPDIKSAIENTLAYQPLYSEALVHQLVIEDGYAGMVRWDPEMAGGKAIQLNTLVIVQIFKTLKALGGGHWQATSISFSHSAPVAKQQYLRYFQCPVYFDREYDGVVFPESVLSRKIRTADSGLLKIVLAHYDGLMESRNIDRESGDIVAAVSGYIRRQLGTNLCNLASCAHYFDMHPRALQRALAESNCSFKSLLSRLRMEVATHYLRSSSLPLAELAEMLGYRNPSAFTRAFKNVYGVSPADWKKSKGTSGTF